MSPPGPGFSGAGPVLRVSGDAADGDPEPGAGWTIPEREGERLQRALGGELITGGAFGRSWPVVVLDAASVVAPGVPVPVASQPADGPDGTYDLTDGAVWRTAASGRRTLLLVTTGDDPPGRPVDLLWFEDTSRWVVHGGTLEIEDAFSRLTVPASPAELERHLVRTRRVDVSVLDGLRSDASPNDRAVLEVWREVELVAPGVVCEPLVLLRGRPEIARFERRGDRLEGVGIDDSRVELDILDVGPDGWTVERRAGRLPFDRLCLERLGPRVRLSAELVSTVDALQPGVRERLSFDLFADLVAVDRERGQNR